MLILSLIGNLGKDAETKNINGKEYLSFSVASTEKKGEQEVTTWISVLVGNNPNLLPYLKKGQQVFVSGKMNASIYQSQNNIGMDISVFASTLQLCGGKRDNVQQPAPVQQPQQAQPQQTVTSPFPPAEPQSTDTEPDLPF